MVCYRTFHKDRTIDKKRTSGYHSDCLFEPPSSNTPNGPFNIHVHLVSSVSNSVHLTPPIHPDPNLPKIS